VKILVQHIENLLPGNDCVVVPGLGGFVQNVVHARIQKESNLFHPATKEICFNPKLRFNDGLLAQSYQEIHGMSFEEANQQIQQALQEILSKMEEGKYVRFGRIGTLSKNEGQLIFRPDNKNHFLPEAYGLSTFTFPTLQASDTTVAQEKAEPSRKIRELALQEKRHSESQSKEKLQTEQSQRKGQRQTEQREDQRYQELLEKRKQNHLDWNEEARKLRLELENARILAQGMKDHLFDFSEDEQVNAQDNKFDAKDTLSNKKEKRRSAKENRRNAKEDRNLLKGHHVRRSSSIPEENDELIHITLRKDRFRQVTLGIAACLFFLVLSKPAGYKSDANQEASMMHNNFQIAQQVDKSSLNAEMPVVPTAGVPEAVKPAKTVATTADVSDRETVLPEKAAISREVIKPQRRSIFREKQENMDLQRPESTFLSRLQETLSIQRPSVSDVKVAKSSYYIILSTFSQKSTAEIWLSQHSTEPALSNAFIVNLNGWHRVCTKSFTTQQEANKYLDQFAVTYPEYGSAWIYTYDSH
jgi:hypothetical protein